jgi:hypothetical protein
MPTSAPYQHIQDEVRAHFQMLYEEQTVFQSRVIHELQNHLGELYQRSRYYDRR